MTIQTSRRSFLAAAGALTVGVALPGARAQAGVMASRLPLNPERLATYISINADGSAVGWIGKIDKGQGADYDATGVRLRRAPLTPERVKAGMAQELSCVR